MQPQYLQYLPALMYAGLAGTALALVVATGQNRWSPRVFFLLALRLAIGWHFLFEGLHKVHSHLHPSETTRSFSSEPYFKVAPGPIGARMRKSFGDPDEVFAQKVRATEEIKPADFDKLSAEDQAKRCPAAVAADLDAMTDKAEAAEKDAAEKATKAADADAAKAEKEKKDDDKAKGKAKAEAAKKEAEKRRDSAAAAAPILVTAAKAKYARWVYGVEGRDTKLKSTTGEAWFTAPQRLDYLDWLRGQVAQAQTRADAGVGNGTGTDAKRMAEYRTDLIAAEAALAKDTNDFVAELKKDLNGGKAPEEPPPAKSFGQKMDLFTMWFLMAVGGCLMAGLFTRLVCVLGTGFLVVTYLAHPPFPWYPQPPNTEGNPLFINKNVIEALALLAVASFPTGRWLGLDALISKVFCRAPQENDPTA
ncbi:MAG TPA: DoxX family protein [Urbifossiella sp.]|nr:DoxX family protein [Urbifossiella sp.]